MCQPFFQVFDVLVQIYQLISHHKNGIFVLQPIANQSIKKQYPAIKLLEFKAQR